MHKTNNNNHRASSKWVKWGWRLGPCQWFKYRDTIRLINKGLDSLSSNVKLKTEAAINRGRVASINPPRRVASSSSLHSLRRPAMHSLRQVKFVPSTRIWRRGRRRWRPRRDCGVPPSLSLTHTRTYIHDCCVYYILTPCFVCMDVCSSGEEWCKKPAWFTFRTWAHHWWAH